jgi:hypothetical protein
MTIRITPAAKSRHKSAGEETRSLIEPERRSARRFCITWNVIIKGTDDAGFTFDEPGELEVLSSGGAVCYLARLLKPGAELKLWIRIPVKRDNWMVYRCEVVHIKSSEPGFRVAVKFDSRRPGFMKGQAGSKATIISVES